MSRRKPSGGCVIVAGLAGGLSSELRPGDVVIPAAVETEDGMRRHCDPDFVHVLTDAAVALGYSPRDDTLLSARTLVTGTERERWSGRGYSACDMETGFLPSTVTRFATVRVVLDTPTHSMSDEWLSGGGALFHPHLWREFGWLALHAPRYGLRAARITREALPLLAAEDSSLPVS